MVCHNHPQFNSPRSAQHLQFFIPDWAKTFKIPQSAVNELLQILKIKRIKTDVKGDTGARASDGAATSSLQQRKSIRRHSSPLNRNYINSFSPLKPLLPFFCYPSRQHIPLETVGLFSKIFQRLEGMERNLMNRMTTLERKVDMKNIQQLKIHNTNQASPQPK